MDEEEISTEQDLMEYIQSGLDQQFVSGREAVSKSKTDSLQKMKKALPDWSLEPPETFLA